MDRKFLGMKPIEKISNKAITMMRRKSPPSKNIYFIENHCQTKNAKGRSAKDFNIIFMNEVKLYFVYMSL